jgi:protein-tyrosine-phosphatase
MNHKSILFLCVANSARSQMAEGLLKARAPHLKVQSAGSKPSFVHPLAIKALAAIGIDNSQATSKSVETVDLNNVDGVITLCQEEICPTPPKNVILEHWPLPDPAAQSGTEDERLAAFCRVRDEIMKHLEVSPMLASFRS